MHETLIKALAAMAEQLVEDSDNSPTARDLCDDLADALEVDDFDHIVPVLKQELSE